MAKQKDAKPNEKEPDSQQEQKTDGPVLQPISTKKRSQLQKCFEHGSKLSAKGEFDYADAMFRQCVSGDPANLIYTQNLLTNLKKKYNKNALSRKR